MSGKTAEQQARDLLEHEYGLEGAQSMTAGDVVELANLISDANAYRRMNARIEPPGYCADVVGVLRERLAEDEKFISDRHGYCEEYMQNARVEFVTELVEKYRHWAAKAEGWDYAEDYCNVRDNFLHDLLRIIARNWESFE